MSAINPEGQVSVGIQSAPTPDYNILLPRNRYLSFGHATDPVTDRNHQLLESFPDSTTIPNLRLRIGDIGQRINGLRINPAIFRNPTTLNTGIKTLLDKVLPEEINEAPMIQTVKELIEALDRKNQNGIHFMRRKLEDRVRTNCCPLACLLTAVLRKQGVPTRARAVYESWIGNHEGRNIDHWIIQYFDPEKDWINVDLAAIGINGVDWLNVPSNRYTTAAEAWGRTQIQPNTETSFIYEGDLTPGNFAQGHIAIQRQLFLDAGHIVGAEPTFRDLAPDLSQEQYAKLAQLMLDPDGNFFAIKAFWDEFIQPTFVTIPTVVADRET